ncbi:ABC transporter permease subunit [Nocardiopsis changdeensis]|uniref:Branched-chain amino acid ABC transporter permease n=1 Tax=Nocardiopsis changdeensis TaxID=2831969 RepID=A0ABX8BJI8_9ACTN|nr:MULTISPECIES: branched-chain amino acid ABC transporter permease [Nocardiopsis]QUX21217.1 branched-chain amino acid ABC transporter permease [Nocardiopsis changdeensis]QYX37147.1 branched-chain amino acid ABC transporter permease [Nocardiopsis sp. MT53]
MRTRLVTVLLALITAILVIPGPAATADEQGGEALQGQIRNPDDRDQGVEGITIQVFDGEDEIGAAETDSDGNWVVELPGPGTYRVVVDQESVPAEFSVRETAILVDGETEVEVEANDQRPLIIALEPAGGGGESDTESPSESDSETPAEDDAGAEEGDVAPAAGGSFGSRVIQLTAAGLLFGLVIAISAIGLSLIFGSTKMINFAHGDMVTFGAMVALVFSSGAAGMGNSLLAVFAGLGGAVLIGAFLETRLARTALIIAQWSSILAGIALATVLGVLGDSVGWQVPLWIAAGIAVVMGAVLGASMERYIWRPLRRRNVALIQMFIVSIGLALILRHVILVLFGADRSRYAGFQIQEVVRLGPIAMPPRDLVIMGVSVVVLVLVACLLQFTRIGKAMRAVSDNRDLAESSGIDVDRVTLYVWGLGGGLAALGGVLYGLNQVVQYEMGFRLLLLMFAAVILGGLGTAYGAMVGGIAVGLVAMLSTLWFPSQLMQAWALALMILMLLVRPQGLLGRAERVG